MIKTGIIGLGFIGQMHLANLSKSGLAEVVAVADKNPANLSGEGGAVGNIAIENDINLEDVTKYDDGDKLLQDRNVEAVFIAVPTYLHKEYILKAFEARKHILCEKPMTLNTEEGQDVLAALKGYDKVFMVAHCIRFWPGYAKAYEIIRDGTYGKVLWADFTRNSPKPGWSWKGWMMDEQLSGGAVLDLHIHDVDFVSYLFGKPDRISAGGIREGQEGIQQVMAVYTYDDGKVMTLDGGWNYPPTFPFRMTFCIVLEEATLEFNHLGDMSLHVHTASGEDVVPELASGDGYSREQEYFFQCIESGERPSIVTPESSLESLALVEVERKAVETGQVEVRQAR